MAAQIPEAQALTISTLPGEVRELIIEHVIDLLKAEYNHAIANPATSPFFPTAWKGHQPPPRTTSYPSEPLRHDFSINAFKMRCHTMWSFPLLFVSKTFHRESTAVLYRHCSLAIFAEVTGNDGDFGFIPNVLGNVTNNLRACAQNLSVMISGFELLSDSTWDGRRRREPGAAGMRQINFKLQKLVHHVTHDYPQRKKLNIVLEGQSSISPRTFKTLLGIFNTKDEEVCFEEILRIDRVAVDFYDGFNKLAYTMELEAALAAAGVSWMQATKPVAEIEAASTEWRAVQVAWARRRVWKRATVPR